MGHLSRRRRSYLRNRVSCAVQIEKRCTLLETLEPRVVLAADPLISEFQAINVSTLQDADGDYSDWIEIRNPDTGAVNLQGWFLTDDSTDLRKWRFPAVTLEAGENLIVFASGKDRTDPNSELHTNFKLAGNGEFLALVKPDGVTVAQQFNPYPAQFEDQSYGLATGRDVAQLIVSEAAATAFVPGDGSLGTTWTETNFDDTAWLTGSLGVGYEVLAQGFEEREDFDAPLGPEWTVDRPQGAASLVQVADGKLKLTVPSGQEMSFSDRGLAPIVFRSIPGDNPADWEVITEVTQGSQDKGAAGIVIVNAATGQPTIQLEYQNRLSFRLIGGGTVQGSAVSLGRDHYFLRLQRDGIAKTWTAFFKLNAEDDWRQVGEAVDGVDNTPPVVDARVGLYGSGARGSMNAQFEFAQFIVPDEREVYGPETNLSVLDHMNGHNASVYVRIPFNVAGDPTRFDEMDLVTRFDDGFRAFLNGTEIVAENVPIDATWNSAASANHGAVGGTIPVTRLDVADKISLLQSGKNVLAIHGMNLAPDDKDFFFDATLTAAEILSETEQFFIQPTPGATNTQPASPQPLIVGDQGAFFGSTTVELTLDNAGPNFQIHYTLDGSDPTLDSPLYSGPLTLTESARLQARTFDTSPQGGFAPSNPAAGTFVAVDPALKDFTSDIPVMLLDTLGQGLPGTGSTSLVGMNVVLYDVSKATGRAAIDSDKIDYLGRGGARDRGSSTAGQPKPNMSFETWGPDGTDKDDDFGVSLLGLPKDADWVLHAPANFDRALIRNQLAFALSNGIDDWAPHFRHVEVYLNRRDGVVTEADYAGVYVILEKIEQGPNRVDVADITPQDNQEPEISGGYIWKVDRSDPDAGQFTAGRQGINWVYPKSPRSRTARDDQKATTEQQAWVIDYFNAFADTLRNPDINDPEGYSKYIDPITWADQHMLNVFMMNVDALRLSAYFYKDRNDRVAYGPPWDFDRSAESTDDRDDNPYVWRAQSGDRGTDFFGNGTQRWWGDLFKDPGFWQVYVDRWQMWRRSTFSDESVSNIIDQLSSELLESQERNFTKWRSWRPRTNSGFASGLLDGTYQGEVENLRQWMKERGAFMDSNFVQPPLFKIDGDDIGVPHGTRIVAGQQIEIASPPIERFEDSTLISGEPGETIGRYFVPIDDSLGDTWTQVNFNDVAWQSGPTGVGFDSGDDFTPLLRTILRPSEVDPAATTIMARIPFEITDLDAVKQNDLVLRMKYDDGYIAYLNGVEVQRKSLRSNDVTWTSRGRSRRDSEAVEFEDVNLSEFINLLQPGTNVLAVRVMNSSASNGDMLLVPELVSRKTLFDPNPAAKVYYTTDGSDPRAPDGTPSATAQLVQSGEKITINGNTRIIARNFDDVTDRGPESRIVRTDWSGPVELNFVTETAELTISEVNYNPATASEAEALAGFGNDDFEFIEIYNAGNQPANLVGVELTDGVEFDFFDANIQSLAPGARAVVVRNADAFAMRYGDQTPIAGVYSGSLDNNGEDIDLIDGTGNVIFTVNYGDSDPWPARADGVGSTLELVDPDNTDPRTQTKWYRWQASTEPNGTPGTAGAGPVGVVVNEVLARTSRPVTLNDSIELYNTTGASIDISGWFLSDSADNLFKFQIPAGTLLPAGGYVVYDASTFNAPGNPNGFGLNGTQGDSVYLTEGSALAGPTRFIDDIHFGATFNGESWGRIPNGSGRLAPLQNNTFAQDNGAPRVGPIVITEIQYNPVPSAAALAADPTLEASDLEFIEIHNPTGAAVSLDNWRVRGGVDFNFPAGTTLAAGQFLVLLKFNPENPENINQVRAFRDHYGIGPNVTLIGGYAGLLSNSDDRVRLLRPDLTGNPDPADVPYVQEDEVLYDDLAPWPVTADGVGTNSLQRRATDAFGNDAASWLAAPSSPGQLLTSLPGDFDGNGVVDAADINALFVQMRSNNPDLAFDLTGDAAVDDLDRDQLIIGILGTTYGDANLDRIFNSSDLLQVFQAGEYNDATDGNSTWEEGDWDGDGDFGTRDLLLAFQRGGFVAAANRASHVGRAAAGNLASANLASAIAADAALLDLDAADAAQDPTRQDQWLSYRPLQARTTRPVDLIDQSIETLFEQQPASEQSSHGSQQNLLDDRLLDEQI